MQIRPLLTMLAVTPLAAMLFWLVKLRRRKGARQMGTVAHPQAALDAVR
jgi:hypothetical protein